MYDKTKSALDRIAIARVENDLDKLEKEVQALEGLAEHVQTVLEGERGAEIEGVNWLIRNKLIRRLAKLDNFLQEMLTYGKKEMKKYR